MLATTTEDLITGGETTTTAETLTLEKRTTETTAAITIETIEKKEDLITEGETMIEEMIESTMTTTEDLITEEETITVTEKPPATTTEDPTTEEEMTTGTQETIEMSETSTPEIEDLITATDMLTTKCQPEVEVVMITRDQLEAEEVEEVAKGELQLKEESQETQPKEDATTVKISAVKSPETAPSQRRRETWRLNQEEVVIEEAEEVEKELEEDTPDQLKKAPQKPERPPQKVINQD